MRFRKVGIALQRCLPGSLDYFGLRVFRFPVFSPDGLPACLPPFAILLLLPLTARSSQKRHIITSIHFVFRLCISDAFEYLLSGIVSAELL